MDIKKRNSYNIVLLILKIFKRMPILTLITFTCPLISGLLTFYTYTAQINIINVIAYNNGNQSWKTILSLAIIPLTIYTSIYAVQAMSNGITNLARMKMNSKITLTFKSEISEITNNVDFQYFDDEEFCNKLERAKSVVGEDLVGITNFLTTSISIIASLWSIIWLAASIGYFSIVIVVIVMIGVNLSLKLSTEMKVRRYGKEVTLDGRRGDYLSNVLVDNNSIAEMRIYNSMQYFLDLWGKTIVKQHSKRYGARRFEIKMGIIVTIIQTSSIFFILLMLLNKVNYSSNVTIGTISVLFLALLSCGNKIMSLTWPLSKLYISSTKLYDLNQILKLKKTISKQSNEIRISDNSILPINITDMSFQYKKSDREILSNINLSISRNEKIAVVGENGAGKSTLIKLLLGQYSPTSGIISWNNITDISTDVVSNKISVVFQNFIKFELSLRENVGLGSIKDINNDKLIIDTLKKCDLEDLYEELGSLDVPLGRLSEGGRQLSGGQWQKLAIARAIFNDSELIVFDEPTSSIDPNAEVEIFNKLMDICKNKTAIFISHRMGWAKNADKIIVMDNGRIAEIGTHSQLIKADGLYKKMYNLQASWYTETA